MDEDGTGGDLYESVCVMLAQGAMPVVVPMEDGLHVVSLCATSKSTLSFMINDDQRVRLRFVTQAVIAVHESLES